MSKYVTMNVVLGLRLQYNNVFVVILRELIYVNRDVHWNESVADLSINLLAKRIDEQYTPKRIKWSTNYPINSSANVEGSKLKNVKKFLANYKLFSVKQRCINLEI